MKIVFFGTPAIAVPTLRALIGTHSVVAAVTQPDRPRDRGRVTFSPVKEAALACGVPVLQPERIKDRAEALAALGADIGVTCAYGQILNAAVLDAFPFGIVNVHASLLPAYRGSSPVQWAILNGETRTGITVMQTALGVDCGDILAQLPVDIGAQETAGELLARIGELAPPLLLGTLAAIADGTVTRTPQDESKATHFPMLKKETGFIDWTKDAGRIAALVRGTDPWPGASAVLGGERFGVVRASVREGSGAPGTVLAASPSDGFVVACGAGALSLDVVRFAGKRPMAAADWLRGHRLAAGTVLC